MLRGATVFLGLVLGCLGSAIDVEVTSANSNRYFIYTRDNPNNAIELFPTVASALDSRVTYRPVTDIIVHGHQATGFTSLNPEVKDAFLASGDVNVIVVDWSADANLRYSNAVRAVPGVGEGIADFINVLATFNRIDVSRIHLVGFNLGAHVIGFTGRALNGTVARITGLDPSARQWGSSSQRLRITDARYVEVIHTDGSGLTANGLGTAIGDVDFFPNGGSNQPGCLLHSCSHERAWKFFAVSVIYNHLVGNNCATSLQLSLNTCRGYALAMGNNELVKDASGVFRVNTGRSYPY